MSFTEEQIAQLDVKLSPKAILERREGGRTFSYIEGWHAISEANRVFGFGNWSSVVLATNCVVSAMQGEPNYKGKDQLGYLIAYTANVDVSVSFPDGTAQHHTDVGYGEGINYYNVGQAHESAVKEAVTDAEKRALRHWGNLFGLALYDKQRRGVGEQKESTDRQPKTNGPAYSDDGRRSFANAGELMAAAAKELGLSSGQVCEKLEVEQPKQIGEIFQSLSDAWDRLNRKED